MEVQEQADREEFKNFLAPSLGLDGEWRSSGSLALQESLRLGSMAGALEVLAAMDENAAAACLRETGFPVSEVAAAQGRQAILEEVQADLNAAIAARVDGFGLARKGAIQSQSVIRKTPIVPEVEGSTFGDAIKAIQQVMQADRVEVRMIGDAKAYERSSLLFIAGQALDQHVQGFEFEGIPGKYDVSIPMQQMMDLHREAARAVGEESARRALGVWVSGGKVAQIHEWVLDSVQKLLHGSVSLESAASVVDAIKGGAVGRHASAFGTHGFATLLAEQGFDVNAKTVGMQAEELGLEIVEPDRQRGQYVGSVVGVDHRACLLKFNRKSAVELPFNALGVGQNRPDIGDRVRMSFKNEALTVSVAPGVERGGQGR